MELEVSLQHLKLLKQVKSKFELQRYNLKSENTWNGLIFYKGINTIFKFKRFELERLDCIVISFH